MKLIMFGCKEFFKNSYVSHQRFVLCIMYVTIGFKIEEGNSGNLEIMF